MVLQVILPAILFAPIALIAWLQLRLRRAVARRHPSAIDVISKSGRWMPRGQRWYASVQNYRRLRDPEINRRIQQLGQVETIVGWAILILIASGPVILILLSGWR